MDTKAMAERINREREELLSTAPHMDTERVVFQLESYKETDGMPAELRRAKLIEKMCNEKTLFIDNNPIVGTVTKYKVGHYPFPEYSCRWMKKQTEFCGHLGSYGKTDEDAERIERAIEYWGERNTYYKTRKTVLDVLGEDINKISACGVWAEDSIQAPMIANPDYPNLLKAGLNGIIAEVEEEKGKLNPGDYESFPKWQFYNAVLICLRAVITLAGRYALLARDMAENERDPERKEELERIAERCEWVPANRPRTFHEAVQFVWFLQMVSWVETAVLTCVPARFTQYMYPFYKEDKGKGIITDEEVTQLLQLYFIKIQGLGEYVLPMRTFSGSSARLAMHLVLGGLTPDGKDATNELDFLVLEAHKRNMLPEPLTNLFYHNKLSEDFLLKCVDVIRTGIGQPAFFNTEVAIQQNLFHHGSEGITLEEARNLTIWGCVQNAVCGVSDTLWEGFFNMPKMLELALNNGKDPLNGRQIGPQNGSSFESYQELHDAVKKQFEHFFSLLRSVNRISWNVMRDIPVPWTSSLNPECIRKGKDLHEGGAKYSAGSSTVAVGMVDLANSLAAIKKLVFEEKKITLEQLKEALAADFKGSEEILQMCLDAPKYGNNDAYTDSITKEWYDIFWHKHREFPDDFLGRPIKPEALSVTTHAFLGSNTGALPNGRRARTAITDASVSAQPGTDTHGPTALINSAAQVLDCVRFGANHFNVKFHPSALEGLEGARKFLALVKTYMDLGGYHIQFNCVGGDKLKDAQLHPEDYRDLVVRVAGFSAFFIHLDKPLQDEIIKRTELKLD